MGLFSSIKKHAGALGGAATGGLANIGIGAAFDYARGQGGGPGPGRRAALRARAGVYNGQIIQGEHERDAENAQRQTALGDLDRAYTDPSRTAGREAVYAGNLQNQLAGLQYGYGQASQHAGLAAARHGRLGSSYDASQQGALRSDLQNNVMGAEANSYGQLDALRTNDENAHQAMRRSILAGDPQTAAAYNAQALQYGNDSQQLNQRAQQDAYNRQIRDQQRSLNYTAAGDTLGSIGGGVRNYYGYYGGF